jgi:two-component system sensor histidine kinase DegS
MKSVFLVKVSGKLSKSGHFWAVIFITLVLILIYQAWPWREWKFTNGIWQWFPWLSSFYKLALAEITYRIVGIPFFVPIIYGALVLPWRGSLAVCLLSLVGLLPVITDIWSTNTLITNIVLLLMPFLIVSIVTFALEWRRKERRIFAEREAERQIYVAKVLEAQENERWRIAQELHDDTIQTLLVIANRTQNLISANNGEAKEVKKNAEWIRDATLQAVGEVRRLSLDLRPSILDDLGLVPALRWLVDCMNEESAIHTRILVNGNHHKLSPQAEANIFRVTQEALTNIKRHSEAKEAVVNLEFAEECLKITIDDNGRGFHLPKNLENLASGGSLGLIGIKQRIDFLGGTLKIRSQPGEGTSVVIEIKY